MRIIRCQTTDGASLTATDYDGTTATVVSGSLTTGYNRTDQKVTVQRLLPPVEPTMIIGIGLNYRRHAEEMGVTPPQYPVMFMKMPSAAIGHGDTIRIPSGQLISEKVDWECELAVIIGRTCSDTTPANALDYVAGYTAANDVSARDWQIERSGSQWCRGKSFASFCPLGPVMVTADELTDPQSLTLCTRVNGETMQSSHTGDMIFTVAEIISFLSSGSILLPGTVILTGTPAGVGMGLKPPRFLKSGDSVEIEIERIGVLKNTVI
jgi:2-keto-4-pentenoate hydratase/2-oxohepta-3-ene-1,7-dioic acid hydratase in catechol pathway